MQYTAYQKQIFLLLYQIWLHAFKHIVGEHTDNQWLAQQIQSALPHEQAIAPRIQMRSMVAYLMGLF
jgi:hypothetical protein